MAKGKSEGEPLKATFLPSFLLYQLILIPFLKSQHNRTHNVGEVVIVAICFWVCYYGSKTLQQTPPIFSAGWQVVQILSVHRVVERVV